MNNEVLKNLEEQKQKSLQEFENCVRAIDRHLICDAKEKTEKLKLQLDGTENEVLNKQGELDVLRLMNSRLEEEVKKLKKELEEQKLLSEFVVLYSDPRDISFRNMVENFFTLSLEDKNRILNLTTAMVNFKQSQRIGR